MYVNSASSKKEMSIFASTLCTKVHNRVPNPEMRVLTQKRFDDPTNCES